MLPKGILFDLDDTIVSYSAVADPTWHDVCREYADRYTLGEPNTLFTAIREIGNWYWSDAERHKNGRNDLNNARRLIVSLAFQKLNINESIALQVADAFSKQREDAVHLFDGGKETLEHLRQHGVLLALMTNGEGHKQRSKIRRFDLEKYFNAILIEGEMGFGKPEMAVYYRALDELGLKPEDVWSVGDNLEWDVGGPQKLGIHGIWNDHARQGLPPASKIIPDRIIHQITELID
ncbi:MAG: HAD family hydrolase [Deltaproteobacteria bacterium]|nr:HAD family hydrolase [Deltaproteobacteria bacterium]